MMGETERSTPDFISNESSTNNGPPIDLVPPDEIEPTTKETGHA
jgi:hypothetical protein